MARKLQRVPAACEGRELQCGSGGRDGPPSSVERTNCCCPGPKAPVLFGLLTGHLVRSKWLAKNLAHYNTARGVDVRPERASPHHRQPIDKGSGIRKRRLNYHRSTRVDIAPSIANTYGG